MKLKKLIPSLELKFREELQPTRIFKANLPKLLEAIGTPIALSIHLRLKYNVEGYPEVHPFNYDLLHDGINRYKEDNQALAFVSKSNMIDRGVDTREAAIAGLAVSEGVNKETNNRLRPFSTFDNTCHPMHQIINDARDYLSNLLGPASIDWNLRFTGGSTATVRGDEKLLVHKILKKPSITPSALRHFYEAIWRDPAAFAFASHHELIRDDNRLELNNFEIVRDEVIEFVDKNWKTDRLICLQATINMCLQSNVGSHIKRRLTMSEGITLGEVPLLHEKCVKAGLFRGYRISTVDLKAASDRISEQLVKLLLPVDWFSLLNDIRHKTWDLSDYPELSSSLGKHPERFSAMGNGFTFELETIIFRSICYAVCKRASLRTNAFSVFGDDIIIPTKIARELVDVLNFLGFEINHEKTFIDSPFLESCGCDVYYHIDSRAIYYKDFDKGLRGLYELLNRIRATARTLFRRTSELYRVWVSIIRFIRDDLDPKLLIAGPSSLGDSNINCSRADAARLCIPTIPTIRHQCTYAVGILKKNDLVKWQGRDTYIQLAYMLLGADSTGQMTASNRFCSRVAEQQIVAWTEHDWL